MHKSKCVSHLTRTWCTFLTAIMSSQMLACDWPENRHGSAVLKWIRSEPGGNVMWYTVLLFQKPLTLSCFIFGLNRPFSAVLSLRHAERF